MGSGWNCASESSLWGEGGKSLILFDIVQLLKLVCSSSMARVNAMDGRSQIQHATDDWEMWVRVRPTFLCFTALFCFLFCAWAFPTLIFSPFLRALLVVGDARDSDKSNAAQSSRNESRRFYLFFFSFQKKETRNSSENSRISLAKRSFSLSKCPVVVVVVWTDVYRLCEGVWEFSFNFTPPSMWGKNTERARHQHEINIYIFFYCVCSTCDYKTAAESPLPLSLCLTSCSPQFC